MATKSKTACIAEFLKSNVAEPPKVSEVMELKKSVTQAEWDSYYDQLPLEFKNAE